MFFCREKDLGLLLKTSQDFNSIISFFILQCVVIMMKTKFGLFKKIIFFLVPLLFVSSIFINACLFEDLGLPENIETQDGINDVEEEVIIEVEVDEEELFLEMREKQRDINPLSDINVRKAIFHSVDRERIATELFGEYGKVLNSLFEEGSPFFNPSWAEYDYDLKKAEEYLKKANFDVDNPLYLTISTISNSTSRKLIEEIIQEDLKKIGINLWIYNKVPKEWYQDYVKTGNYELGIWSLYNYNGTNLNNIFYSNKIPPMETEENKDCENFYWYENPEVNDLLDEVLSETEAGSTQKEEIFIQIQDILAGDAVILPLYSRIFSIAYSNKIKQIDIKIKNNNLFFNIEEWILPDIVENDSEIEEREIIIGVEGKGYDILDSFKSYFINDLLIKGLWEINENGEYDAVIADDFVDFESSMATGPVSIIEITLKDDIRWENGDLVTPEDIKNTYERLIEIDSFVEIHDEYLNIDKIEVIDEKSFNLVFKKYYKDWKKLFDFILSSSQLENAKDILDYTIEDIRSLGPYKVSEFEEGNYLLLEKNGFYFGKKPEIDLVRFVFDEDINNLISMLKDGEIDVLSIPVDLDLLEEISSSDDLSLLVESGNLIEHLALSLKPIEE